MMGEDEIIRLLREHRNKLVRPGEKSLGLVGSSRQGEDREQSDLHFSVELAGEAFSNGNVEAIDTNGTAWDLGIA